MNKELKACSVVSDSLIEDALREYGWKCSVGQGRLMLLELLAKTGAGYYISYTEGGFLSRFGMLRLKNGGLSKLGRKFLMEMVYMHSNRKPRIYYLADAYRSDPPTTKDSNNE